MLSLMKKGAMHPKSMMMCAVVVCVAGVVVAHMLMSHVSAIIVSVGVMMVVVVMTATIMCHDQNTRQKHDDATKSTQVKGFDFLL